MATAVMTTGILGQLFLAFFAPLWALAEMVEPKDKRANRPAKRATRSPRGELIFRKELCEMLHVSAPTIWVWQVKHGFPKPIVCVGKSAWVLKEVLSWLDSRPRRKSKYDPPNENME